MESEFIKDLKDLRKGIKDLVEKVNKMRYAPFPDRTDGVRVISDDGEMRSNLVLSLRHLEDARMRLGKVLQAYDGGVSVYDK